MSLLNFYLGQKYWIDGSHVWEQEMAQKRWDLCKKQKLSFWAWIVKSFELLIPSIKLRYVLIEMSPHWSTMRSMWNVRLLSSGLCLTRCARERRPKSNLAKLSFLMKLGRINIPIGPFKNPKFFGHRPFRGWEIHIGPQKRPIFTDNKKILFLNFFQSFLNRILLWDYILCVPIFRSAKFLVLTLLALEVFKLNSVV